MITQFTNDMVKQNKAKNAAKIPKDSNSPGILLLFVIFLIPGNLYMLQVIYMAPTIPAIAANEKINPQIIQFQFLH